MGGDPNQSRLLLGGVAIALVGGGLLRFTRGVRCHARESARWPSSAATVTASAVIKADDGDGGTVWVPKIAFAYRAGGRDRAGDRLRPGAVPAMSRKRASAVAAAYPVGARVRVWVDPADPDYAVLEPGITEDQLLWEQLGRFLSGLGLGTVLIALVLTLLG